MLAEKLREGRWWKCRDEVFPSRRAGPSAPRRPPKHSPPKKICICSGECEKCPPPGVCEGVHPARSISAHLAHSPRINCISARERRGARQREREKGLVLLLGPVSLQGESFQILPPMWLLVFTLMTPPAPPPPLPLPPPPPLPLLFTPRLFLGLERLQARLPVILLPADTHQIYARTQINNACLLTSAGTISGKISTRTLFVYLFFFLPLTVSSRSPRFFFPPPGPAQTSGSAINLAAIFVPAPPLRFDAGDAFTAGETMLHLLSYLDL